MDFLDNVEFELKLEELRKQAKFVKQFQELVADLMANYYNALKEKGFSAEEALTIVLTHGFLPPYQSKGESGGN